MTEALSGSFPGALVSEVEVGPVEDGTNRRARVRLGYSRGTGPETVFVKAHGRVLHRLALLALGAFATEARLAQSGFALPVEHPRAYAGGVDLARLSSLVVMEDITSAGGRPNDGIAPLGVAQVRAGLEGLAGLHGTYWDRPGRRGLGFLKPWRLGRPWAPVSLISLQRGMGRLKSVGRPDLIPDQVGARLLERQFRQSALLGATGSATVLHGDPHPANTYSLPGGGTGFYDWQLARTGSWSHDVGYFIIGSLDVASRRAHEADLLETYLDALARSGGQPPPFAQAWDRYRASPAFGLGTWLHTLSGGSFQPLDVCLATVSRFAAAYEDLGTCRWKGPELPAGLR